MDSREIAVNIHQLFWTCTVKNGFVVPPIDEATSMLDQVIATVRAEVLREAAERAKNAILDYGTGVNASYYSPMIRRDLAAQLAERAILADKQEGMDKKVAAGQFVVSLWRANDHPGGMDWVDTCIDMVIKRDATVRSEALREDENPRNDLQELIDKCKCGVFVSVNEHKDYYQSAKEAWEEYKSFGKADEGTSLDVVNQMIETDTIIQVQFYPDTPIGSYVIFHYSLKEALKQALGILQRLQTQNKQEVPQ